MAKVGQADKVSKRAGHRLRKRATPDASVASVTRQILSPRIRYPAPTLKLKYGNEASLDCPALRVHDYVGL